MIESAYNEREERAYDRFIRNAHIAPLTLFGFFPALIISAVWLALARTNHIPHNFLDPILMCVTFVCLVFTSLYGIASFAFGWRYASGVLQGTKPFPISAGVVLVGYIINTVYFYLIHRGDSITSEIHGDFYGVFLVAELCLFGPISEELALQGFVQTRLRRFGIVVSLLGTTIIFVCMHLTELPRSPGIADIGHIFVVFFPTLLVYALVRQMTGSLLAAIVLHSLNNATIAFSFVK